MLNKTGDPLNLEGGWMDLRALSAELTGEELSLKQLAQVDERHNGYVGLTVEAFQAVFLQDLRRLPANVPDEVVKRLHIAKEISVRAWFCYELHVVSVLWSLSTIEMALLEKLLGTLNRPLILEKKKDMQEWDGVIDTLQAALLRGWKISKAPGLRQLSLRGLLRWARDAHLLALDTPIILEEVVGARLKDLHLRKGVGKEGANLGSSLDILVDGIPVLRNDLAHPKQYNWVVGPGMAQRAFLQSIAIIKQLWMESRVTNLGEDGTT